MKQSVGFLKMNKWLGKDGLLKKTGPGLWVLSGAFGILNAAGLAMYARDHLPWNLAEHGTFWLTALAGTFLFYLVAKILYVFGPRLFYGEDREPGKFFFLVAFGVILLGWLPWLVSYYPMSADYDVYKPILQYLDQIERTNDFPWFYCTTVGWFYSLGLRLGDKNVGMFLYIAIRAVAMAMIYASLAVRLRKLGVRKWLAWAVILFYAVTPVWGAYAKHGFKDTQSAAFFCWYIMETVAVVGAIRKGDHSWKPYGRYAAASLAISLYRGNCIWIAVPVTLLLILAVLKTRRENRLRIAGILLSGVLVFEGYQVFIRKVEDVAPGNIASALTIPFQQSARMVRDHGSELTELERVEIGSVLDVNRIGELYDPLISDPVKDTVHELWENKFYYLRGWLRQGFRFPLSYLEALIGQTYGYYAFNGDQALHAGNWNCGMTIFNWVKDPRYDDEFTCDYVENMGPLREGLDRFAEVWHGLPGLNLTDRKAIYTWLVLLAGTILLRRKRWMELIPVCGMILTILFCCGSPVNDCFRYFAPVAAATPALLLLGKKPEPFPDADRAAHETPGKDGRLE